jgi:hypothetical protein
MDREKLSVLRAELQAQMREIDNIYVKLEDRRREKGRAGIESTGYQLHNLYCAFEDLFKIVARTFENQIQDESQFHIELLKRMTMSIEGVRPAVLSPESYRFLDSLRAFRHFFRHAYGYELDERKIRIVLEDAVNLRELHKRDIEEFLGRLGD